MMDDIQPSGLTANAEVAIVLGLIRHSGIWGAADEAVLNKVLKIYFYINLKNQNDASVHIRHPDEVSTARTTHAAWPTPPLTTDCCTNPETDLSWEKKIGFIQPRNELPFLPFL